ncbi:hypothetical protein K438DRAFT_1832077, partial [Mycena galopus ATCC 62051]
GNDTPCTPRPPTVVSSTGEPSGSSYALLFTSSYETHPRQQPVWPNCHRPPVYTSTGRRILCLSAESLACCEIPQISSETLAAERKEEEERQRQKALDDAWAARRVRDQAARKARLEAEAAEALKGEIDWVRSGGILRDAQGNRDYARTEAIREELRLSALEATWKAGRDRNKPRDVQFQDVPWPVCPTDGRPVALAELTVDRVEDFLLAGLKVRGCTVTKKERVRTSLLRWHPDKMTTVLARIVETDLELFLNSKVETTG